MDFFMMKIAGKSAQINLLMINQPKGGYMNYCVRKPD